MVGAVEESSRSLALLGMTDFCDGGILMRVNFATPRLGRTKVRHLHKKTILADQVAEEEGYVGGALVEAAHEVGEPVAAEGDVDPDAVAVCD